METIGRRACRRSDGGALATPVGYGRVQYGYISNVVSAEQGVGTAECPWYIQVRPGQRINFTILNFLGQPVHQLFLDSRPAAYSHYSERSAGRPKPVTEKSLLVICLYARPQDVPFYSIFVVLNFRHYGILSVVESNRNPFEVSLNYTTHERRLPVFPF